MPKYLVKFNEKSFIGGDLMICKADDLTSLNHINREKEVKQSE